MEQKLNQNDGFTLIEVIIAIAVLAILSLPLLSYFSSASVYSSKGRDKQRAQMAAQSVMEEMAVYTTRKQLEDLTSDTTSGWKTDADSGVIAGKYYLQKEMTVDGFDYKARVLFDYTNLNASSIGGGSDDAKFNDYEVPDMENLYSENNVVASEKNEKTTTIQHFKTYYTSKDLTPSESEISNALTRTTNIYVTNESTDMANVKVDYTYQCNYGGYTPSYTCEPLINEEIAKTDLKKVVVLFKQQSDSEDSFYVSVDSTLGYTKNNFSLCLVCQGTPDQTYGIRISGDSGFDAFNYYISENSIGNTISVTSGLPATNIKKFLSGEKKERIADVTVWLFDKDETNLAEANSLVTLHSAKGV